MEGDPEFEASQNVPGLPLRATTPSGSASRASASRTRRRWAGAWDAALSADRPTVLDVRDRPERPAAAAPHQLRTGAQVRPLHAGGRPAPAGRDRSRGSRRWSRPSFREQLRTAPWAPPTISRCRRWRPRAYSVPTDAPESDGTLTWDATGLVVVHARAGDETGLGFAYTIAGRRQARRAARWRRRWRARTRWRRGRPGIACGTQVRNLGRPGVASSAIAAVDIALWDLKARLLGVPLVDLFGALRAGDPGLRKRGIHLVLRSTGSGRNWPAGPKQGFAHVKMKVGRDPDCRPRAGGGRPRSHGRRRGALRGRQRRATTASRPWPATVSFREEWGVTWMEEPVSSDDHEGPAAAPRPGPRRAWHIAAGEYGGTCSTSARCWRRGAVDVAAGGRRTAAAATPPFLRVAALCDAHCVPLSAHTAPASTHRPCAPSTALSTSSTSTTTRASSPCSSTERLGPRTACCAPAAIGPGMA